MKKITTLLLLLSATATYAQKFDMFLAGGLYSDKPTNGSYPTFTPASGMGREILPKRSSGYYFGLGGEMSFGKKLLRPGFRVQLDYVGYMLQTTEYYTTHGSQTGTAMNLSHNVQYLRVAPSFTLSRNLAAFRVTAAAGPAYNIATRGSTSFIGLQAAVGAGFKGIMLHLGYAHGFTSVYSHPAFPDKTYVSSRAFFAGLSLHPRRFR